MAEHEKTVTNLSNRLSIYRGHHEEKEKRYLATYNCLIEKQRQETLQLQQQILNKESKKKSNKTGPRPGSRSVKKASITSDQQQHSFIPEKIKQEDDRSIVITMSQPHNLMNNLVNTQSQPPESQSQHFRKQMTSHHHHHQQPIQQLEQPDPQPHHYQQFQHTSNIFHNQYGQSHPHPSPDSQYLSPQTQTHQFQAHHNSFNDIHHYLQPQSQPPHPHPQPPHLQQAQNLQNANAELQYQKTINQGNYYSQEFKELKDEDLACLDNFQNSAELPLSGFAPTYEQEIFLDPNFIERFLNNI